MKFGKLSKLWSGSLLALCLGSTAWGYSIVQHTTGVGYGASFSLNYTSPNSAGNLLLFFMQANGTTAPTVSDSLNGSWTQAALAGGTQIGVSYLANCKSGSNTVTVNAAGATYTNWMIVEVSGVATASPLDVDAKGPDHVLVVPYDTPLKLLVHSSTFILKDAGGKDLDETTTTSFTAPQAGPPPAFVLNVDRPKP